MAEPTSAGPLRRLLAATLLALGATPASVGAVVFVVDTTDDTVDAAPGDGLCADADGDCSLRAAIQETNALAGNDEIELPAGTYLRTRSAAFPDTEADGDLDVLDGLLIRGAGAATTIVDADSMDRVLETGALPGAQPVELRDLTLRMGNEPTGVGGGGIRNQALLTLVRCRVVNNDSNGPGGGIASSTNPLYIFDSAVDDNTSGASGGGLYVLGSLIELHRSSVSGNTATNSGGGATVATSASLVVQDSTFSGNEASTTAGAGGGIQTGSTTTQLILRSSTLVGNAASNGGGFFKSTNTVLLANTIVAGNTATAVGPDCYAFTAWTSGGHNLLQTTTDCPVGGTTTGNLLGVDPQLGGLADNGGPTRTHLPAPDSPVVDAGDPATPGGGETWACATSDQRGAQRPLDGDSDDEARCDIGAVERVPFDFGDAPSPPYPTLLADDGARHGAQGPLALGALRDGDADGQPDPDAAGDDSDGGDDEDGVVPADLVAGEESTIAVTATAAGQLDAWADFDGDGVWEEGDERLATGFAVLAGSQDLEVDVPVDASAGWVVARFRLSGAGGLAPTGSADDGEVEDHRLRVLVPIFAGAFEDGFAGWSTVVP